MSDKAAADTTLLQALRALASDAEARATLGRLADALDEGVAEARLALQVAAGCFEGHTSIELHGPLSSLEPIAGLTGLESITLNSAGRGCDLAALAGLAGPAPRGPARTRRGGCPPGGRTPSTTVLGCRLVLHRP